MDSRSQDLWGVSLCVDDVAASQNDHAGEKKSPGALASALWSSPQSLCSAAIPAKVEACPPVGCAAEAAAALTTQDIYEHSNSQGFDAHWIVAVDPEAAAIGATVPVAGSNVTAIPATTPKVPIQTPGKSVPSSALVQTCSGNPSRSFRALDGSKPIAEEFWATQETFETHPYMLDTQVILAAPALNDDSIPPGSFAGKGKLVVGEDSLPTLSYKVGEETQVYEGQQAVGDLRVCPMPRELDIGTLPYEPCVNQRTAAAAMTASASEARASSALVVAPVLEATASAALVAVPALEAKVPINTRRQALLTPQKVPMPTAQAGACKRPGLRSRTPPLMQPPRLQPHIAAGRRSRAPAAAVAAEEPQWLVSSKRKRQAEAAAAAASKSAVAAKRQSMLEELCRPLCNS